MKIIQELSKYYLHNINKSHIFIVMYYDNDFVNVH